MLLKDMKPNTEYATCDGFLVVTLDTVERGWFSFTEHVTDQNTNERKSVSKMEQGDPRKNGALIDPWANCAPSRRSINIHEKNGIRVKRCGFDRDGKRTEIESAVYVLNPGDIPGTWADYALLHGDAIEARFARAELEEHGAAWQKAVKAVLREAGIKVRDAEHIMSHKKESEDADSVYVGYSLTSDWNVKKENKPLKVYYHLEADGAAVDAVLLKLGGAKMRTALKMNAAPVAPSKTPAPKRSGRQAARDGIARARSQKEN